MKKIFLKSGLLAFILFFSYIKNSKAQELQFQYDPAGNQIVRQFVCVNCSTFLPVSFAAQNTQTSSNFIEVNKNSGLSKSKFVAYPNPLTEVLNLKWVDYSDNEYINKIEVSSSDGISFFQKDFSYVESSSHQVSVLFQKKIPGMYVVTATFTTGKQEFIKVIKHDTQ